MFETFCFCAIRFKTICGVHLGLISYLHFFCSISLESFGLNNPISYSPSVDLICFIFQIIETLSKNDRYATYTKLSCTTARKYVISAPPRSTQHDEKPLGLFWQFRPSTSNNNNTLYHNLLQDLSIRRKTRDRAERQFTQLLLSDGGQKKKNPGGKKVGRKSG